MNKESITNTEPVPKMKIQKKILNRNQKNPSSLPLITSNIQNLLYRVNSQGSMNNNIYNLKKDLKRTKNVKSTKKLVNSYSLNQKKFKIKRDLDMVYQLNIENDVDKIFEENIRLKKEKEKIDDSKEIKEKRLNIFKNTFEKQKEKKIEVDSKEKEKIIEKKLKDELEKYENIKKEYLMINKHINENRDIINEFKLELNVFKQYGDILDRKFFKDIKEKEKEKSRSDIINDEIVEESHENDENSEKENNGKEKEKEPGSPKKISKKEKMIQILAYNKKKEERLKFIKETINMKEDQLKILEDQQNKLTKECRIKKTYIHRLKQQLLNIYNLNLYEGLSYHSDGLASLIRAIWNLGVNVDINYMPSYLDDKSVNYLFDRAKRLIEISKIRQILEENKKEFEESIEQFKQQVSNNEENKDSDENTNSYFFKTGVLENYPKSKQFMDEYNKKFLKKNVKIEIKNRKNFKTKDIPYKLMEKYKKIEKIKYLLNILIEQNNNKEEKEIQRLCKEFSNNNYQQKYQVSFETVIGALCGEEKKDEKINLFSKYQKEYKEGKKLILFHNHMKRFSHKNI